MEANRSFAEKYQYPYPLLCDTDRTVGLAYGACDTAEDEYARRITYVIGHDGTIKQAHAEVTPQSHAKEILGSL